MVDYRKYKAGLVVIGDAFDQRTREIVDAEFGVDQKKYIPRFPLTICDPPYGDIVKEDWDETEGGDVDYDKWLAYISETAADSAIVAMWGGIGKPENRPFLEFAADVESRIIEGSPCWTIDNWITWSKKRAYGVKKNYLFTREECLILRRGEPTFNIPLLDEKRGYAGYNAKYPAKSEFLRRTNVWTDITEIFQGKIHPTQKPDKLYEVLIETHTNPGDIVYDPCAGSLTTLRACLKTGRRFCCIERKKGYVDRAILEIEDQLVF